MLIGTFITNQTTLETDERGPTSGTKEQAMAKNTGKGHRIGPVKGRSEFTHPNGTHVKRDTSNGQFMNVSRRPHKGVRNEKP